MVSIFDEELEKQRQQLQSVGVTPEMTQIAAATPEPVTQENLLQMPMSPMERMMEEDGKAKTIGKMLLGGFTGTMPFMFPGMAGEKQRYEHELEAYYDQQNQMRTQNQAAAYEDMLYDDDPNNDIKALQMGAIMQLTSTGPFCVTVCSSSSTKTQRPSQRASTSSTLRQGNGSGGCRATGHDQHGCDAGWIHTRVSHVVT